jgi:small subunit ribosomal protein S6
MNTYEAFVILKPILDVDNSDNVLKSLEALLESVSGKILKKDKLGRKRLAYEIRKFKDGFFVTYQLALEPDSLAAIYRAVRINEDILRFALVSRSKAELNEINSPPVRGDREQRPERGPERPEFRPRREFRA